MTEISQSPKAKEESDLNADLEVYYDYWGWLSKSFYRLYFNKWLIFHFFIGFILSTLVPYSLTQAAQIVLLPLAGLFVGLTFSWSANAVSLLQTEELQLVGQLHQFREWTFKYQSAILVVILSIILWGIFALGVPDRISKTILFPRLYVIFGRSLSFAFSSLALHECWGIVNATQNMLLMKNLISYHKNKLK